MEHKDSRAFTLIELLVVISIIGMLASIVLVSLNGARDKGRIAASQEFAANIYHTTGDRLVGQWDFNDCSGSTAYDYSGVGNSLTLTNNPVWTTDIPGGSGCALSFGGTSYGKVASLKSQPLGNASVTIAAWVKPAALTGTDQVIACIGVDGGTPPQR